MARIIIAEDDPALAKIITKWIESAGHTVSCVGNGVEGVRTAIFDEDPDLIITDVLMPEADGEDLATFMEIIAPGKDIIVVTACADKEKLDRIRAKPNVKKIFPKPIDRQALLSAIETLLGENEENARGQAESQ